MQEYLFKHIHFDHYQNSESLNGLSRADIEQNYIKKDHIANMTRKDNEMEDDKHTHHDHGDEYLRVKIKSIIQMLPAGNEELEHER